MSSHLKDSQYIEIVNNILDNEDFQKIKKIEHHGISRYDHSLKVSYYSYKVSKMLKLDYEQVAVGGLLHDFFLSKEDRDMKDRAVSFFVHPKKALQMSENIFDLTLKEKDMIKSHMFPMSLSIPKYLESWIVSSVDKVVAVNELSLKCSFKLKYVYSLFLLFIFRTIR